MLNDTMLRLAEHPNIVGVKDCAANPEQSTELIQARPSDFAVLTGEGDLFHNALMQGADGGILASAHVMTSGLARVRSLIKQGNHAGADALWPDLEDIANLLFSEPSPAPIKHWLWRVGLIDSPEVRLPMTMISDSLADRIDLGRSTIPEHLGQQLCTGHSDLKDSVVRYDPTIDVTGDL